MPYVLKLPIGEDLKIKAPEKIVSLSRLSSQTITFPPTLIIHPEAFQKTFAKITGRNQRFQRNDLRGKFDNRFDFIFDGTSEIIPEDLEEELKINGLFANDFSPFSLELFLLPLNFGLKKENLYSQRFSLFESWTEILKYLFYYQGLGKPFYVWSLIRKKIVGEVSGKTLVPDPHLTQGILTLACWGDFEEGLANDSYQTLTKGEKIIKKIAIQKTLKIQKNGQVRKWPIRGHYLSQPKLNDSEILKITGIAQEVRERLFLPHIIEWVLKNGTFFIIDLKPQTNFDQPKTTALKKEDSSLNYKKHPKRRVPPILWL